MAFVNPYTFIGFPKPDPDTGEVVRRRPPLGHTPNREQAQQRYTGTITVSWTLRSALATPNDGSWGFGDKDTPHRMNVEGELFIPGSSVKGSVRSVHEALFGGCARITDLDYQPVYREIMSQELLEGWQLAVVIDHLAADAAGGFRVFPCDSYAWVRAQAVKAAAHRAHLGLPRTGDFVDITQPLNDEHRANTYAGVTGLDRGTGLPDLARANRAARHVILVTSTTARNDLGEDHCYWAAGRLAGISPIRVGDVAIRSFRDKRRGSDTAPEDGPLFEEVGWPPNTQDAPLAMRRTPDGHFRPGDVIWIKRGDSGEVVDIKLSAGWRRVADSTLKERLKPGATPCTDIDQGLCLTCSIFGSADTDGERRGEGKQRSYGSHVRFGPIVGPGHAETSVKLAPLGTPHMGAGMYYLREVTHAAMDKEKLRNDLPSQWDSPAGEVSGERALRGRKFYWHSDPARQRTEKHLPRERFRAQDGIHTNPDILPTVHLVTEADLSQTITFDGLDALSLASLLAALQPGLVLGEGDFALHLGKGKPLGLGSVTASCELSMTTTADRYGDHSEVLHEVPDLTRAIAGIPSRCGDLNAVWNQARTVLSLTGLGPHATDVAYPTTQPWTAFTDEKFHQSYEFFKENNGQVRKVPQAQPARYERGPWAPLPAPTDDPIQKIQRKQA